MLNISISSFFPFYSRNNGLSNADLQLATRMKEGRCTPADEAILDTFLIKINDAFTSPEGKTFFENPTVQRRLIKGVLDEKITDQRILDRLKDCAVCLTQDDQIDLIKSRANVIRHFSFEQFVQIGFVLRFFDADQSAEFFNDPAFQVMTVDALFQGRKVDPCFADGLQRCTSNLPPASQEQFASYLCNDPSSIFWKCFNLFTELSDQRQQSIADAIRNDKFNTASNPLLTLAQNLKKFTNPRVRLAIANAIAVNKFGKETAVFLAIAQNLSIFKDANPGVQQEIAKAIQWRKFGTDPVVLQVVAENLSIFTDPQARQMIELTIENGKFDNDLARATILSFQQQGG